MLNWGKVTTGSRSQVANINIDTDFYAALEERVQGLVDLT
jgi:hypothetical protein